MDIGNSGTATHMLINVGQRCNTTHFEKEKLEEKGLIHGVLVVQNLPLCSRLVYGIFPEF